MPLVIFTLQLSQFPIPARIDIVLRDNTTQERQYLQLWGNLTNKQHQQDYHNQIITLQLSPGTYTIKKSFQYCDSSSAVLWDKQLTVKDSIVSYIGNIHIINGGPVDNGMEKYIKLAVIGREK